MPAYWHRQVAVLWVGSMLSMSEDTKFQFFLARLFGDLITAMDGDNMVTGYIWRGSLYVTAFDPMP